MTTLEKVKLQREIATCAYKSGYYYAKGIDNADSITIANKYVLRQIDLEVEAMEKGLQIIPGCKSFASDFDAGVKALAKEIKEMEQVPTKVKQPKGCFSSGCK